MWCERGEPHAVVSGGYACYLVANSVNYIASDVNRLAVAVHRLEGHAVLEARHEISALGIETHVVVCGAALGEGDVLAVVAIFHKDRSVAQVLVVNLDAQVAVAFFPIGCLAVWQSVAE